jgi:hypothetical protein
MSPDFDDLSTIRVREAHLESMAMGGIGMIGGIRSGDAQLVVTAMSGDVFEVPVDLTAGSFGLLLDMTLASFGRVNFDLPTRGDPIRGNQLFGTYRGSRESIVVLFGPEAHHVQNPDGVRIDQATLGFGIALAVSAEWLTIKPDLPDEPDTDTDFFDTDTGAVPTDSSDTGRLDTGDTGLPSETGETGMPVETGDTGMPAETGDTGSGKRWPAVQGGIAPIDVDRVH